MYRETLIIMSNILKPHPDYDFVDNDKVFVENSDGTVNYFCLSYEPELSEWILIPYTDKNFTAPKENSEGKVIAEPMNAYGYDLLERIEDYDIEELL